MLFGVKALPQDGKEGGRENVLNNREKGEIYFDINTKTIAFTGYSYFIECFFAAAEIAVVSLNGTKLRRLEEEGDKKAGRLLKLVEEPASFLSTIQVGITMAGFLGSAFAADNFPNIW